MYQGVIRHDVLDQLVDNGVGFDEVRLGAIEIVDCTENRSVFVVWALVAQTAREMALTDSTSDEDVAKSHEEKPESDGLQFSVSSVGARQALANSDLRTHPFYGDNVSPQRVEICECCAISSKCCYVQRGEFGSRVLGAHDELSLPT